MTRLTLGFTGTTEEAAEMAEDSRKTVKERVGQGSILDYTGSGVEHVPDETCPPSQNGKVREILLCMCCQESTRNSLHWADRILISNQSPSRWILGAVLANTYL